MLTVGMRHDFCAAHRLIHHAGKCSNLHGHNYQAYITVGPKGPTVQLSAAAMLIDFARVKEIVGGWIDSQWDHKTVLNAQDPMLWEGESLTDPGTPVQPDVLVRRFGHRPYVLGTDPTAEALAEYLGRRDWFELYPAYRHLRVARVTVYETEKCSATWES